MATLDGRIPVNHTFCYLHSKRNRSFLHHNLQQSCSSQPLKKQKQRQINNTTSSELNPICDMHVLSDAGRTITSVLLELACCVVSLWQSSGLRGCISQSRRIPEGEGCCCGATLIRSKPWQPITPHLLRLAVLSHHPSTLALHTCKRAFASSPASANAHLRSCVDALCNIFLFNVPLN
ncbi:uncharacterized protein [Physcomitrium patens]|uniref:uncharacterized protein n=1 Tax=Physcomitrium patens TaxID=3218 RepID=UPI000D160489|nr:uncharacterized protein LOC112292579 isoform X1 [Physcomitrium patens]|eukprot:XP_024396962.1 uncharacterized protein LOC112292579 isoform X1 [Physcomitrella patens]